MSLAEVGMRSVECSSSYYRSENEVVRLRHFKIPAAYSFEMQTHVAGIENLQCLYPRSRSFDIDTSISRRPYSNRCYNSK